LTGSTVQATGIISPGSIADITGVGRLITVIGAGVSIIGAGEITLQALVSVFITAFIAVTEEAIILTAGCTRCAQVSVFITAIVPVTP
jgi:hypothetical protein